MHVSGQSHDHHLMMSKNLKGSWITEILCLHSPRSTLKFSHLNRFQPITIFPGQSVATEKEGGGNYGSTERDDT